MKKFLFLTTGEISQLATIKRALGMAPFLREAGLQVHIAIQESDDNKARLQLECPGAIPAFFPKGERKEERQAKVDIIRQLNPDFLYAISPGYRNLIFRNERPQHSTYLIEYAELLSGNFNTSRLRRWYERWTEYQAARQADVLVPASKYLFYYFEQKKWVRPDKQLIYLPYAYNESIYKREKETPASADVKEVLYLGTLSLNYGFLFLIEACAALLKEGENIRLRILGSGRHKQHAIDYIQTHQLEDKVVLEGFVPEAQINSYLEKADVFVAPLLNTIQDKARCPSKLFLYLPYQRPVITCRVGEAYELFGERGNYYKENDMPSLKAQIRQCIRGEGYVHPEVEQHSWRYRTEELLLALGLK